MDKEIKKVWHYKICPIDIENYCIARTKEEAKQKIIESEGTEPETLYWKVFYNPKLIYKEGTIF